MSTLTVTAKGQVTFRKDLLQHLGVRPGEKLAVHKLPNGRIEVQAARPKGQISDAFDFLKREGGPTLSIEEMKEIARRPAVKLTADTNLLVRALTGDDASQSKAAQAELASADLVALTLPALCELVWVLSKGYRVPSAEIAEALRLLINGANVVVNRPAAEAGLAQLEAGGDFADGATAFEGSWLGAEMFVSFDKQAVELLKAQGQSARFLS